MRLLAIVVLAAVVQAADDDRADLKAGRAALRRGDYETAVRLLKAVSEARPDSWDARARLVEAQTACGKRAEAESTCREFLKGHADHAGAAAALSTVKLAQGDPAAALEAADAGLRGHAADPRLLLARAQALAALDRKDEAVKALEGFEESYRKDGGEFMKDGLVALATGLTLLDDLASRPAAYRLAVDKILPLVLRADGDPAVRALLGFCHLAKHRRQDAAKCFTEALSTNPNLAAAHVGLGRIALDEGQGDGAAASADRALGVDAELVEAHVLRIRAALLKRDFEAGLREVEESLKKFPKDARLDALRDAVRELRGEGKAASPAAAYEAGRALVASRRFREAADCFDRAGATLDAKVLADLNRFRAEGKDLVYKVDADDPDALVQDLAKLFNKFAGDYKAFDVEGFRARLPRRAQSWLEPWARELLSTVWTELKKRWGDAPEAPVLVIFAEKLEEAVCLSYGAPGASGCLGRVIVLPVPNGEFSWAAAIWRAACQSFLLHRAGSKTPPDWLFEGVGEYCAVRGFDRSRDLSLMLGRRDGRIQRLADAPAEAVQYLAEKNGWTGIDRFENADAPFLEWLDEKLAKIRYIVPPKPDDPRIAGADEDPKDADKSVAAAAAAVARGRFERAAKYARQAVEADPNSVQGHSLLGQALRKLRQTDEAREHLKKAVELGADDYRTWYMLGDTLESLDDHEGAVEAFGRAMAAFPGLTADPAGESVYRRLARLHRRAEAPEMEMRVLAAAAALDPADVKNRWKLARHYEKEPATAIAFLREIAWVQPEDKALYDALAKALAARKEYAAAVDRRMIVVALIEAGQTGDEEKDKGEEYREIAALYLAQGLKEKARDFAKEALKLIPGDERARKLYEEAGR